jgi:hypothetical protein
VYIPFWPFVPSFYEIITGIVLGGHVTRQEAARILREAEQTAAELAGKAKTEADTKSANIGNQSL